MLVDPEQAGPFVQRDRVSPQDSFHTGAGLPPEFQIRRVHGPGGGDQVGDLLLSAATAAPVPDVLIGGSLHPVFELAHPGEMLTGRRRQCPPRKARVLADLPEAGAECVGGLLG